MKKVFVSALTLLSMLLIASPSTADEDKRSFGEIYTDCGLGALIAQGIKNEDTADVVAVISNITFDLGTTAISSNATTPDSCARGKAKTAAFILKSYPQLEKELALGYGKYLDTLMSLRNVPGSERSRVLEKMRQEFVGKASSTDFERLSQKQKSELLYDVVVTNS